MTARWETQAPCSRDDIFDEIILSTLPPGIFRWLRIDLPSRVRAEFGLLASHLISTDVRAAR